MKIKFPQLENGDCVNHLLVLIGFALGTLTASAITVPKNIVDQQLNSAELVADIQVDSISSVADPIIHARSTASAQILNIHRSRLPKSEEPSDKIEIDVPGGEIGNRGVLYSGFPRPRTGSRYLAYLNRIDSSKPNCYQITGFDWGLSPLSPQRKSSRNRTDGSNGNGSGPFLYWDPRYFPIPFYISSPSFKNLPDFVTAIETSFKTWRAYDDVLIEFAAMGCNRSISNENEGLNTVILIKEEWPFDTSAIAITRNFYVAGTDANSGLILDSDILLNQQNYSFTTTDEPGKHDIQNIVTHEIGHFLGFGHEVAPFDEQASMYASANPGETNKRILHSNDIAVLREAYSGVGKKLQNQNIHCDVINTNLGCLSIHSEEKRNGSYWALAAYLILTLIFGKMIQRKSNAT